jgi:hypothetical protein
VSVRSFQLSGVDSLRLFTVLMLSAWLSAGAAQAAPTREEG